MSEEQEYTRFLVALGMASFKAQSLEHSLVSLFTATSKLEPTAVRRLMDTRYSQTLGKLIRDAAKELQLSEELTMELEDALQKRNWVTHHFFREYGAIALSSSLCNEATQRLETIWPMFETTANNVNRLVIEQQARSDRSEEQIQAGIEHALKEYLSEKRHT